MAVKKRKWGITPHPSLSVDETDALKIYFRLKEVKILDVDVAAVDDRPLGLLFHARWTAMGTVGHWGHIHMRKNQYDTNITVEPVEGPGKSPVWSCWRNNVSIRTLNRKRNVALITKGDKSYEK